MRSVDALVELETVGSWQWGLVTSAQAVRAGVDKMQVSRFAREGTLRRVRRGVYALPSAGFDPLEDVRAVWLASEPALEASERGESGDVVVSHASAAVVHGLGDLVAAKHELTSTVRRQTSADDVRYHRRDLPPSDVVLVDGLPVTTVGRTVADLARARTDLDHLAGVVRDGMQAGALTYEEAADRLAPHAARYGARDGHRLVDMCLETAGLPATAADLAASTSTALLNVQARAMADLARHPGYSEWLRALIQAVRAQTPALPAHLYQPLPAALLALQSLNKNAAAALPDLNALTSPAVKTAILTGLPPLGPVPLTAPARGRAGARLSSRAPRPSRNARTSDAQAGDDHQ